MIKAAGSGKGSEKVRIFIAGLSGSGKHWPEQKTDKSGTVKDTFPKMLEISRPEAEEFLISLILKAYRDRFSSNIPAEVFNEGPDRYKTVEDYLEALRPGLYSLQKYPAPETSLFTDADYGLPDDDEEFVRMLGEWRNLIFSRLDEDENEKVV